MKSNPNQDNAVTTFIVEVPAAGRVATSRTAEALACAPGVRYLRSILVPLDGTSLHFVEGPTAAAIGEAATPAAIRFQRIVKTVDVCPALPHSTAPALRAA
ncbi:MAG TPA: hypothetical protein VEL10_07275 [Gaiellaceae bacterium]|nr:hypothetical protein [Gaiellaceae bacterium]